MRKREERGALVTQLARFMVAEGRRGPNVESQVLGAALRALLGQFCEDFCRMHNQVAILNRSLPINTCAFITTTLRVRKKTLTPALREGFGRRPSLTLRLLTNPFDARLGP